MSSISKIINVILFVLYSILCVWIGYHSNSKKTVLTAPSTVVFRGIPDSVKLGIVYPHGTPSLSDVAPSPFSQIINNRSYKPDSVKTDTSQPQVLYQLDSVHTVPIQKPARQYASYKTFSDSLGDYAIKVLAKSPVDSVLLTIHHFQMRTVEIPDKWKYFEWGMGVGALGMVVIED